MPDEIKRSVEKGLQQAIQGETKSHQEVMSELKKKHKKYFK